MQIVGDFATRDVLTCDDRWTIRRVGQLMRAQGLRHVPLVDDEMRPKGLVVDARVYGLLRRDLYDVSVLSATEPVHLMVPAATELAWLLGQMLNSPQDAALVVDDAGKLVGIFTEHDALKVASAAIAPHQMTVGDVARTDGPIYTIPLGTPAYEARTVLLENKVRHLIVVDDRNRLAGVVSFRDLEGRELGIVDPTLHAPVHEVGLESDLHGAIERMVEHGIGSLPVVGPDRTPLGLITRTDVLRELQKRLQPD